LGLCATDGELSAYATAQVQVTASTPSIESQTAGPFLDIPLGYVNFPVTVTAGGVPAPTYQWQYLTYENYTAPDNTTVPDNTTASDNSTTVARRSFDFDDFGPKFPLRWHGARAIIEVCLHAPHRTAPTAPQRNATQCNAHAINDGMWCPGVE
jgi:hypothetical protein